MRHLAYISLIILFTLDSSRIAGQGDIRMIEERISKDKVTELGEDVTIIKTRKVWKPRQGGGGDSTRVNSRRRANSSDARRISEPKSSLDLSFLGPFLAIIKYVLIIALICILIYIVVLALQQVKDDQDEKVVLEDILEEEEEDIHEMNLDEILSQALSEANYKNAIRAKFLILLKKLSEAGLIDWSIEKTNRDYLRELRKHPDLNKLRTITYLFELAWYGEDDSQLHDYKQISSLIEQVSITPQVELQREYE